MIELKEEADFAENLGLLLKSIDDEGARSILGHHTKLILSLAHESNRQTRAPLVAALRELVSKRVEDSLAADGELADES